MPDTVVDIDILRDAVQLACRAPSLHNSQPWQWVADGAGLQLYLDQGRILPSADKSGREAHIGCGAILDHLCIAMAAAGWTANVDRFPDPNNLSHLASLDFSPMGLVAGMATCKLSHLTELQSSRHLIGTLTGRAALPQLVIRVGEARVLGELPPITPRRPLPDVLRFQHDAGV
jgi:nitroreductase